MTSMFLSLLLSVLAVPVYKAHRNTKDIKINRINIDSDFSSKSGRSLSILHLSDMHLENISIKPDQLAEKLKNNTIDIIALTGDFLDRKRTIPKLIPYLKVLHQFQPRYGTYAVLGNHDYVLKESDLLRLKNVLQHFGCRVLQNASETINVDGSSVNIIGIDDYSTNRSNLPLAYEHVERGTNIVLTHDPNVVLDMDSYSFDYLLAGHFHGGQICYPKAYHLVKMGKLARKNIIKGLHMHNNAPFYISEGLGQTGLNIRVGSRPEITFHNVAINPEAV